MSLIKKGVSDAFYNAFGDDDIESGIMWLAKNKTNEDDAFEIENGDYVIIKDKETVVYEGFVFYNPYAQIIHNFLNKERLCKAKYGYPLDFDYGKWQSIFSDKGTYNISVERGNLSKKILEKMLKDAADNSKREYENSKILGFSQAVKLNKVTSKDFFNKEINDFTGFSRARLSMMLGSQNIGGDYYFIIEESVQDAKANPSGVINSGHEYTMSDFTVPDISEKIIENYLYFHQKWIKENACNYEEYFENQVAFEREFRDKVKELPIHKKTFKRNNPSAPDKWAFLRCIKVPKSLNDFLNEN